MGNNNHIYRQKLIVRLMLRFLMIPLILAITGVGVPVLMALADQADSGARKLLLGIIPVMIIGALFVVITSIKSSLLKVELSESQIKVNKKVFDIEHLEAFEGKDPRNPNREILQLRQNKTGKVVKASFDDRLEAFDYIKGVILSKQGAQE